MPPQYARYPLYSVEIARCGGHALHYLLDEDRSMAFFGPGYLGKKEGDLGNVKTDGCILSFYSKAKKY